MHSEGVPQLGIVSTIPRRQLQWHAAMDLDEYYRHGRWSIDDRSEILFIYSYVESKIKYRRSKKNVRQNPTAKKPLNQAFLLCRVGLTESLYVLEKIQGKFERGLY